MEQKEIDFICDPDQWPCWPLLPMKRRVKNRGWPELGHIVSNSIDGKLQWPVTLITEDGHKTYDNVEALAADGWMVD